MTASAEHRIRDATPEDSEAIAGVHIQSWQETYRGQLPDQLLDRLSNGFERRERFWRALATSPGPQEALLVAELDDEVIGFAHVCPSRDEVADPNTGEVTAIYLLQAHWGQGVGRALFGQAVARLKEFGFTSATLWVLRTNERTRRFYEAASWGPDGSEKVDVRQDTELREVRYRAEL